MWGAKVTTNLSFEDLLFSFKHGLREQILETMRYLEEDNLFVHQILVSREDNGYYVVAESNIPSKFAKSHSCEF